MMLDSSLNVLQIKCCPGEEYELFSVMDFVMMLMKCVDRENELFLFKYFK